jgi:hypothetical protein
MAVSLIARLGIVQVDVPVPPTLGFVQLAVGPESCNSDTKVELFGTGSEITTVWAVSGP